MELRWLTADEQELEAAIEELDEESRPQVKGRSYVPAGTAFVVIFAVLWYATTRLARWLEKPPRDSQVRAWREHMTGMVNDVEIEPVHRATFVSLITGDRRTASCSPPLLRARRGVRQPDQPHPQRP